MGAANPKRNPATGACGGGKNLSGVVLVAAVGLRDSATLGGDHPSGVPLLSRPL